METTPARLSICDLASATKLCQIFVKFDIEVVLKKWSIKRDQPSHPFSGYRRTFSGVQQPRDEIAHSPHLDPRLRMSGAIPLLPLYAFMSWRVTTFYLL